MLSYKVIYELLEHVEEQVKKLVPAKLVVVASAKILQKFQLTGSRKAAVAGSTVISGSINVGASARVVRKGEIVWDGTISSLLRFKDEVSSVGQGTECGISLDGFDDVREGDVIEVTEMQQVDDADGGSASKQSYQPKQQGY
jgi:translation initiation factor IF-2